MSILQLIVKCPGCNRNINITIFELEIGRTKVVKSCYCCGANFWYYLKTHKIKPSKEDNEGIE